MKTINETVKTKPSLPVKVLQFGEGNFLRAFADYMIDVANEKGVFNGSVAIVKAIEYGSLDRFEKQNCLYTVVLRGKADGETVNKNRVITSVDRAIGCYENYSEYISLAKLDTLEIIISNTTEAGIVLDTSDTFTGIPKTYPGKLTQFLFKRFEAFNGDSSKGVVILPVELIEDNGKKLKACVLELAKIWNLPESFADWLNTACTFCSTLVDRIVTGYPKDEADSICQSLGYTDELLDVAEPFGLWVIESERDISDVFPLDRAGCPVLFTNDQRPYRERKVRILNGAHTSTVLLGWLSGLSTVGECMNDKTVRAFMEKAVKTEIMPYVKLPKADVEAFANSVFERFENPFIRHSVLDISLNSVSKWKARVLGSFKDYYADKNALPEALSFSFAALAAFYRSSKLENGVINALRPDGTPYTVRDNAEVLEFVAGIADNSNFDYLKAFMQNVNFWGEDLTAFDGFLELATKYLNDITTNGARAAVERLV